MGKDSVLRGRELRWLGATGSRLGRAPRRVSVCHGISGASQRLLARASHASRARSRRSRSASPAWPKVSSSASSARLFARLLATLRPLEGYVDDGLRRCQAAVLLPPCFALRAGVARIPPRYTARRMLLLEPRAPRIKLFVSLCGCLCFCVRVCVTVRQALLRALVDRPSWQAQRCGCGGAPASLLVGASMILDSLVAIV